MWHPDALPPAHRPRSRGRRPLGMRFVLLGLALLLAACATPSARVVFPETDNHGGDRAIRQIVPPAAATAPTGREAAEEVARPDSDHPVLGADALDDALPPAPLDPDPSGSDDFLDDALLWEPRERNFTDDVDDFELDDMDSLD